VRVVVISQESRRAMPACVRSGAAGRAATHHFLEIGHSDGCCAFDERRRLASGGAGQLCAACAAYFLNKKRYRSGEPRAGFLPTAKEVARVVPARIS
jgi:hypothetical protein